MNRNTAKQSWRKWGVQLYHWHCWLLLNWPKVNQLCKYLSVNWDLIILFIQIFRLNVCIETDKIRLFFLFFVEKKLYFKLKQACIAHEFHLIFLCECENVESARTWNRCNVLENVYSTCFKYVHCFCFCCVFSWLAPRRLYFKKTVLHSPIYIQARCLRNFVYFLNETVGKTNVLTQKLIQNRFRNFSKISTRFWFLMYSDARFLMPDCLLFNLQLKLFLKFVENEKKCTRGITSTLPLSSYIKTFLWPCCQSRECVV